MNSEVLDSVRQWLTKAESDWAAIEILTADKRCPAVAVCFHGQQYVEKLIKAILTLHEIEAPRTHDLRRLCELALAVAPDIRPLMDHADLLTPHGAQSRYPGDWQVVTREEMQKMLDIAEEFAAVLLPLLKDVPRSQERE